MAGILTERPDHVDDARRAECKVQYLTIIIGIMHSLDVTPATGASTSDNATTSSEATAGAQPILSSATIWRLLHSKVVPTKGSPEPAQPWRCLQPADNETARHGTSWPTMVHTRHANRPNDGDLLQ